MKAAAGLFLLVAWIVQNVFMVSYIGRKNDIDSLEQLRGMEQGYMIYLQFEFMKESKKEMPSLDILQNTGKNYLRCMGHLIDAAESEYGVRSDRENVNTVIARLERLDRLIGAAREKALAQNADPRVLTSRTHQLKYDPALIDRELHEIYDIMYTAFKGNEIATSLRADFAEGQLDSLSNKHARMYWAFVTLYIIGAALAIADAMRSFYIRRARTAEVDAATNRTIVATSSEPPAT